MVRSAAQREKARTGVGLANFFPHPLALAQIGLLAPHILGLQRRVVVVEHGLHPRAAPSEVAAVVPRHGPLAEHVDVRCLPPVRERALQHVLAQPVARLVTQQRHLFLPAAR